MRQSVLKVIQQLAAEEHRLHQHEALTDADRARLAKMNIELDQLDPGYAVPR
jgi:hypothetical protein